MARTSRCVVALSLVALTTAALSQPTAGQASSAEAAAATDPLLRPFRWRSIGPVGQGGRVDDIAVHPTDSRIFFVGFATGGLWKTTNRGTTFRPVFDSHETHSIGDIAIAPSDPDVVYVGTGEPNNRQSSSFGAGMYKSTDGGETFQPSGLEATQTIARVLVHPTDPDIVWVAAVGRLFGPNPERGVFKSEDGGGSWTQVLSVDDDTGATDLVMDPSNPDVLFAATYQRRRTGCCFVGGGPGSGIWRSEDGGGSWSRVEGGGLPRGTMGRIALSTTPADPDVVYAQIEVAADREDPWTDEELEEWQRLDEEDRTPPDDQYDGIWRSTDKGRTWEFRSNQNGRPMYFSQIRVSPEDPELVYVVDLRVWKSRDGARTFEQLDGFGHVDQHALWIDPDDHDHVMIGNDGSVDVTWDQGERWESLRTWAAGQPYHVSVDMRRPYYACTGLQDNGTWCGPSSVRSGDILAQDWYRVGGGDGFYSAVDPDNHTIVYSESQNGNIRRVDLSTGEQQSIRPRAPTQQRPGSNIVPTPATGTEIRWHWNTPFMLSPHNTQTILAGGNRFFVSRDRGDTWTMTPDLSKRIDRASIRVMGMANSTPRCRPQLRGQECILSRNDGVSAWGTISTVAESSIVPGLYWAGTDDGNIQVSRDGGATWTEVSRNLPDGTTRHQVSRVEPSHHDPATAYVSIDGHRSDDLAPYVYVTRDYGESWTSIASDLPAFGNVNTVRQDPRNPSLLYVGTEFGFFISRDEGSSWTRFMPGLPVVRVDDVVVHPRDGDLVLATHGRSVYVMDDVTALQAMTSEAMSQPVYLFAPREAVLWKRDVRRTRAVTGDKNWTGAPAPEGTAIHYMLAEGGSGEATIRVDDVVTGETFRTLTGPTDAGLHRVQWDLRGDPEGPGSDEGPLAGAGVYRITLSVDGVERSTTVTVVEDVWLNQW